jgi:hypothetical protein
LGSIARYTSSVLKIYPGLAANLHFGGVPKMRTTCEPNMRAVRFKYFDKSIAGSFFEDFFCLIVLVPLGWHNHWEPIGNKLKGLR